MAKASKNDIAGVTSIGVYIGKEVFHLVGFDGDGKLVLRRKIKRLALVSTFEKFPRCIVGMESCLSAHFVSRTLRRLGFKSRVIPAKYTRPFVKGQKNDYNDAEAIAEAALRPGANARARSLRRGDLSALAADAEAGGAGASLIDYTATKGAIQGLVRSLAMSLVDRDIRVNAVAPGPVWTPLIPASFDEDKVAGFGGQVPMDRAGQPSEMGPAYVYLASEESSYMNGQTLHLNGGVILNT